MADLELSLTSEQKEHVALTPKTASGKDAKVENVVWAVVSGPGTIVPDSDGMGAYIVSPDAPADGTSPADTSYSVTADGDLTSGVSDISATILLKTTLPLAASLGFTVGTPEAK